VAARGRRPKGTTTNNYARKKKSVDSMGDILLGGEERKLFYSRGCGGKKKQKGVVL